jgi:Hypothetical protein (DUF2513)
MRKDVDLIRLILLQVEGETQVDLSSYSADQINFHKALIKEGGLAEGIVSYSTAKDARSDIPDLAVLTRLTWDGHEFLDKAKSEKTWAKAKDLVQRNGATLSLEAMKIALSEVIKMMLR